MKQPPLTSLHPDSLLSQPKLELFRKLSDEQLIDSLKAGQANSLKARPDGTLIEGHHRIKVLRDRGIDVDSLPREIVPKNQEFMTNYQIEGPWRGQLAIVPRPRGGEWLEDEVRAWKEDGFDLVVSLLTDDELRDLDLTQEADLSRAQGLQFCEFPIPDLGVPHSLAEAQRVVDKLNAALAEGKKVAIHCRQGIGRSGLVAASLLSVSGIDPETAFQRVSAVRGLPVPETQEQKRWVIRLAESVAPAARN